MRKPLISSISPSSPHQMLGTSVENKVSHCNQMGQKDQKGASLIMVMVILTIVSLLGIAGVQISMMAERGARNDRDQQIAWQAAEAALIDAEYDLYGPAASTRRYLFAPSTDIKSFTSGCGASGDFAGLCSLNATGKPAWLTVDFTSVATSAPTAFFGQYTGRVFPTGSVGAQPSKLPRYVVEPVLDQFGPGSSSRDKSGADPKYVYRVTAIGFGPRPEIQAFVQMIYRN